MKNDRKKSLRCSYVREDGSKCMALASKKTGLCAVHSGSVPRLGTSINLEIGFEGIKRFLVRTAMALRRGDIKPNEGNALVNVANALMRVEEYIQSQKAVERLLAQREKTPADEMRALINGPSQNPIEYEPFDDNLVD